jgi:hypothetical protein
LNSSEPGDDCKVAATDEKYPPNKNLLPTNYSSFTRSLALSLALKVLILPLTNQMSDKTAKAVVNRTKSVLAAGPDFFSATSASSKN